MTEIIETQESELIAAVKDGHIVAFSATEAALAELAFLYGNPERFDVVTSDGMKAAKAARKELVSYRTALEAKRKELKAPILARGKLLDDEAKRITGELLKLEQPLDAHITAEETRIAEAEALAARLEAKRVADLQARLAKIREIPQAVMGGALDDMRTALGSLEGMNCASFQEFEKSAYSYRDGAINTLMKMIEAAELAEKQAAELAETKAKQAKQDAELAELRAQLAASQVGTVKTATELTELKASVSEEVKAAPELTIEHPLLFGADFIKGLDSEPAHVEYHPHLSRRQIVKAVAESCGIGEDEAYLEIVAAFCK